MSYSGTYSSTIQQAATRWGVPPAVLGWQIQHESGGNPNAYNPSSGATGIAQFLPSTAAQPGYGIAPFDPTDPVASINAAAQYDAALYQQTGSWTGALQRYGTLGPSASAATQQSWSDFWSILGGGQGGTGPAGGPSSPGWWAPGNPANPGAAGPLSLIPGLGPSIAGAIGGGAGGAGGWQAWASELALRIALTLVGLVLVGAGFYLAGRGGSLGLGDFDPRPRSVLR